ncbi:hypothetical protein IE077_000930 [Cardiosporidium cionae]|uniref:CCR4-NOT transcription complex subunit 4 n=1 Tax=Cardiosporidium cionae TaxID=476202 RepID=A0ABQ7J686_9APIC|nr:hypothetical protein IE077_000930 [Cardiosporidium cionae]|eukprot:KAF8819497.1 hypothetical protein IE077_000930 [Cardiosporidium cionae]
MSTPSLVEEDVKAMDLSQGEGIEEDEHICPICVELLDDTDRQFYPCECGYQICLWCLYNIRRNMDSKCPACRREYDERKRKKEKVEKEKEDRDKVERERTWTAFSSMAARYGCQSFEALKDVRVIQRNLVYVIGLPPSVAKKEILRKTEYFGQYGKIMHMVINRSQVYNSFLGGPSYSVYVTYSNSTEALIAIQGINGAFFENRALRASFGTTKYCSYFLRNSKCNNADCFYLHQLGDEKDSFTKEDMIAARHQFHDLTFPVQLGRDPSKREAFSGRLQTFGILPSSDSPTKSHSSKSLDGAATPTPPGGPPSSSKGRQTSYPTSSLSTPQEDMLESVHVSLSTGGNDGPTKISYGRIPSTMEQPTLSPLSDGEGGGNSATLSTGGGTWASVAAVTKPSPSGEMAASWNAPLHGETLGGTFHPKGGTPLPPPHEGATTLSMVSSSFAASPRNKRHPPVSTGAAATASSSSFYASPAHALATKEGSTSTPIPRVSRSSHATSSKGGFSGFNKNGGTAFSSTVGGNLPLGTMGGTAASMPTPPPSLEGVLSAPLSQEGILPPRADAWLTNGPSGAAPTPHRTTMALLGNTAGNRREKSTKEPPLASSILVGGQGAKGKRNSRRSLANPSFTPSMASSEGGRGASEECNAVLQSMRVAHPSGSGGYSQLRGGDRSSGENASLPGGNPPSYSGALLSSPTLSLSVTHEGTATARGSGEATAPHGGVKAGFLYTGGGAGNGKSRSRGYTSSGSGPVVSMETAASLSSFHYGGGSASGTSPFSSTRMASHASPSTLLGMGGATTEPGEYLVSDTSATSTSVPPPPLLPYPIWKGSPPAVSALSIPPSGGNGGSGGNNAFTARTFPLSTRLGHDEGAGSVNTFSQAHGTAVVSPAERLASINTGNGSAQGEFPPPPPPLPTTREPAAFSSWISSSKGANGAGGDAGKVEEGQFATVETAGHISTKFFKSPLSMPPMMEGMVGKGGGGRATLPLENEAMRVSPERMATVSTLSNEWLAIPSQDISPPAGAKNIFQSPFEELLNSFNQHYFGVDEVHASSYRSFLASSFRYGSLPPAQAASSLSDISNSQHRVMESHPMTRSALSSIPIFGEEKEASNETFTNDQSGGKARPDSHLITSGKHSRFPFVVTAASEHEDELFEVPGLEDGLDSMQRKSRLSFFQSRAGLDTSTPRFSKDLSFSAATSLPQEKHISFAHPSSGQASLAPRLYRAASPPSPQEKDASTEFEKNLRCDVSSVISSPPPFEITSLSSVPIHNATAPAIAEGGYGVGNVRASIEGEGITPSPFFHGTSYRGTSPYSMSPPTNNPCPFPSASQQGRNRLSSVSSNSKTSSTNHAGSFYPSSSGLLAVSYVPTPPFTNPGSTTSKDMTFGPGVGLHVVAPVDISLQSVGTDEGLNFLRSLLPPSAKMSASMRKN